MTGRDRESLLKVCRIRARVAKNDVAALAAKRKAEFEQQISAIHHYDNDRTWAEAHAASDAAVKHCKQIIAARCTELGIPRSFAPSLELGWWGRGENASALRRAELRKVGYTKIDQLAKRSQPRD